MQLAGLDRLGEDDGLDAAGGAQRVTQHRLGRTDWHLRLVAEDTLDGLGFSQVTQAGRCAVGIDVADVFRVDARIVERSLPPLAAALSLTFSRSVSSTQASAAAAPTG